MKRIMLIVLSIFIFIVPNTYAEEVLNSDDIINTVYYENIEELIQERNTTIKINETTVLSSVINYSSLGKAEKSIILSLSGLKSLVPIYKNQNSISSPVRPSNDILEANPELVNVYSNLDTVFTMLKNANDSNIEALQNNIYSMEKQLESLQKQKADMSRGIQMSIIQAELANDQVISGAESLIFTYDSIEREEKNIDKSITQLERKINSMNVQKDLGYLCEQDIKDLQFTIEDLYLAKETISKQKDSIRGQLNFLLGQPHDTPLDIIFTAKLEYDKINSIDNTEDLNIALDNSYILELQQYELNAKKNSFDIAEDKHIQKSDEYLLASKTLEAEKLRFNEAKHKHIMSFKNLYKEVKDKQKLLESENKKLNNEKNKLKAIEFKYEIGLISKFEYINLKESYDKQLEKIESVTTDLFKAYRKYEWMLKGLSV